MLRGRDSPEDRARFIPGTVVNRRYRIVGLLGRGGMGEVYRVDDLKLGKPVALKFLPRDVARDRSRLDRFLNEVKVALQVTHPNTCRVHDIGEVEGQHYLSMEYVDGEDLASLLRRIGRLPQDKAVQIARQLCAGLAAAHEQGVLHRDLKPANIMIDGRGRAKITDFGLASLAGTIEGDDVRAGTPQYMAPEQRQGREVTVRSDIYALGLVLYELFTGRRAFEAATPAELALLQDDSAPTNPSSHVEGLDPAVERVILRCLERDPGQRPATALAVAAALPGGDPVAAALAAGETPSPEMVAAAGGAGGMHPAIGSICLAVVVVGLALIANFYGGEYVAGNIPFDMPPEALTVRAREIIEQAGYYREPVDWVHGFDYDEAYFGFVRDGDPSPATWDGLGTVRPAPVVFWYRQSPDYLVAADTLYTLKFVRSDDPPWVVPGMIGVWLDPRGQLLRFQAVPPSVADTAPIGSILDWDALFEAAGLDPTTLRPVEPRRNPLLDCDERHAWVGSYGDQPESPVRVEAGSYRGRAAYFEIVPRWRDREVPGSRRGEDLVEDFFYFTILAILLVGGPLLARRSLRLGRGDRRGAVRLVGSIFLLQAMWWVLSAHHVPTFGELWLLFEFLGSILVTCGLVWVVYIGLEPYARRLWPDGMIAWSRLLAGRFRDPLIGRDILIGAATGVTLRLWWLSYDPLARWLSLDQQPPTLGSLESLVGIRQAIGSYPEMLTTAIFIPLTWLFLILLSRWLLRRQWIAVVVISLACAATFFPYMPSPWVLSGFALVSFATFLAVLVRFGLVTGVAWALFMFTPSVVVLTLDTSAWYFGRSLLTLLLLAGLAVYAFRISTAGRFRSPSRSLDR